MTNIAIIVAGGTGSRANTQIPKQFMDLCGKPVIQHSIDIFEAIPTITKIIIALNDDFYDFPLNGNKIIRTKGGKTRSDSVENCLEIAAPLNPKCVLIHDAARPGIETKLIDRILSKLENTDGCFPALSISDAIWKCDTDNFANQKIDRKGMFRAQTPQAFNFSKFYTAFKGKDKNNEYLDDVEIAIASGLEVCAIDGHEKYGKITFEADFSKIAHEISGHNMMIRSGMGYDAHRFCDGEFVTICGTKIPHTHALEGHSDADVAWHALVDALLGAIGEGDIGLAFPPSDPKWKGAKSEIFVEYAVSKIAALNGKINNIDLTIVCEAPKIGPIREIMVTNTASILGIAANQVNIKATTTEKMGFTGRKEGIAAYALATIQL